MTARSLWTAAAVTGCLVLSCAPAYDVESIYADLQSGDIEVRQDAQEKIDTIIRTGDYKVFARGAVSSVKTHRGPSILYLSYMKQPAARAALRDLLRVERRMMIPFNPIRKKPTSEQNDSRILVANLLFEDGGDPQAVDLLTADMDGQPPEVVASTCFALGALRDPKAIPFLKASLGNPDEDVVRAAVQALGTLRSPEAVESLRPVLGNPSAQVRGEVLSALQLQDGPSAMELLQAMATSDPDPELRATAISQLGRFKEPSPVPFLIGQLKAKDESSRRAALDALRLLSGRTYGPRSDQWELWWKENRKDSLARP